MDQQVKARLIGATVLVAIAVLLVPELLSGPKHAAPPAHASAEGKRGVRTVTIDLGGAAGGAARVGPPLETPAPETREAPRLPTVDVPGTAAERVEDAPAPAEESVPPDDLPQPAPTAKATTPVAAAATALPKVEAPARPAPAAVASSVPEAKPEPVAQGSWAVQVGAFGTADAARKLVADLKRDGLAAYVAPLNRNGKTLHRVRVGPAPSKGEAEKLAARLKARGLPGSVVPAA